MGLDLNLLPFDCPISGMPEGRLSYSHGILNCWRRGELFEAIIAVEKKSGVAVNEGFTSYLSRANGRDDHYGETRTTPYGDKLMHVSVADLLAVRDHSGVRDNVKNRAIWAYLAELDKETRVALYWH